MKIRNRILSVLAASVVVFSSYAAVPANAAVWKNVSSELSLYGSAAKPGKVVVKDNYSCSTSRIKISWNAVSGASGYRVYRYNGSKWVKIKTLHGKNTVTYRDTGLSSGTVYKYKVKAFKKSNGKTVWGDASEIKSTSTKAKAVTIISTASTNSTVTLSWSKSDGNGYKVKLYRSGQWETIATLRDVNTTVYTISGLSAGTVYQFRVTAYRTDTNGRANGKNTDVTVTTENSVENAEEIRAICEEVVRLVNEERAAEGLSALTMTDELYDVAAIRASEVAQYYSHTRPSGESCFSILAEYGISYRSAGENIAQGYTSASAVVNGWMNSSGHRANILNTGFTKIGVGYDAATHSWVQIFIGE